MKPFTRSRIAFCAPGALAGLCALLSAPARADYFLHAWENHSEPERSMRIVIDGGYFGSNTNFDASGASFIPSGLTNYGRVQSDALAAYGASDRFTLWARASWEWVNLNHSTRSGVAYGFADQTIGANLRIYQRGINTGSIEGLDLQLQVDIPAYNNQTADAAQTAHLGDQTTDFTGGAFLTSRVLETEKSRLMLVGGAGFTWRSNSYSTAVPWSAEFKLVPKRYGMYGCLSAFGSLSLSNDPRASIAGATTSSALSISTGGSYIADAVNPSIASVRGTVGYETADELRLSASLQQAIWGRLAPNGLYAFAAIETRFGGTDRRTDRVSDGRVIRSYRQDNPGYTAYAMEARVTQVSPKLSLVKIDRGADDGVQPGQTFDIFTVNRDDKAGEPVARAQVSSLTPTEATLTILQYYREIWIEEGFIAKTPLK